MAVIGLVGLKRAPECIKMHHFEAENAKIFLGSPSTPSAPPFECLRHSTPQTTFLDTGLLTAVFAISLCACAEKYFGNRRAYSVLFETI